ncbi:MAG: LAGLIDADG family homing endonuclease [Thermoanaerobacterales bacterium]|nr:LAGLIDADG family homing endonuclease [Thermoanaerobacterales bacterium]
MRELSEAGRKVFEARYAAKDERGRVVETFEQAVERIAVAAAGAEKGRQKKTWASRFAAAIGDLTFVPSTPIWANMGKTDRPWQPSACFVLALEDSLESMYQTLKETALVFKSGGGVGYNFSPIRPRGAMVSSTKGHASGVVELIRLYDASSGMVMQGGVRRGASMGILNADHPEIIDFINSKRSGAITHFNLSVGITDAFMEARVKDADWPLVFDGKTYDVVKARDLWHLITEAAHACGDPGLVFLDRLQRDNPVPSKPINATNPCFHPDTLIATEKGLERIEDLYARARQEDVCVATDDRVFGCLKVVNGRTYLIPGVTLRRAAVVKTGRRPTVRVNLANGQEIKVTPEHRLLTARGWVEVSRLVVGDQILVQSGTGGFASTDGIGKELGYFLGWLTGDGWLTKDLVVGMVFSADDEHLIPMFLSIAEKYGGGRRKAYKRPNGTWNVFWKRKDFVRRLMQLGVRPVKARGKRVPAAVFTAAKDTVVAFLQALFSADGTVNFHSANHRDVRLSSGSKALLQDVQLLLLNLGIFSNIYERRKKHPKSFVYYATDGQRKTYTGEDYYELIINGNDLLRFNETVGFRLSPAKDEKLRLAARPSRKSTYFVSPVVSVEPAEEVDVYDIVEPVTHSLIANGIVAHNCGEQPLSPGESCLLGSISLEKMLRPAGDGYEIDWDRLAETTCTGVRFLDDIIDVAAYPLDYIAEATRATRKIGLGVTGLHDMLIMLGLPYDSEEGRNRAAEVLRFIRKTAHAYSEELAAARGPFPDWEKSVFYPHTKRRNAACITIAPTGSVTTMAGCEGYGIEPIFAVAYSKATDVAGTFEVFSPLFRAACERRGVPREVMSEVARRGSCQGVEGVPEDLQAIFKGAQDIAPEDHVHMQIELQKHVDNAISKTVNLPNSATIYDVERIYETAYEGGLKGITIFRDGCKEGVVTVGKKEAAPRARGEFARGEIRPRPANAQGVTHRLDSGCGKIYLTVNYLPENGEIIETFITTGSDGGCLIYTEATSRLISLAIRGGISIEEIVEQLNSTHACPSYQFARGRGKPVSPGKSCASAIARKLTEIKEQLASRHREGRLSEQLESQPEDKERPDHCPVCGEVMRRAEGCFVCQNCGYGKC